MSTNHFLIETIKVYNFINYYLTKVGNTLATFLRNWGIMTNVFTYKNFKNNTFLNRCIP